MTSIKGCEYFDFFSLNICDGTTLWSLLQNGSADISSPDTNQISEEFS